MDKGCFQRAALCFVKQSIMHSRKSKIWVVVFVMVSLLGAWVASRWKAWFYNPPEAPYEAPVSPERVLLTFGDSTELSRNVSWICGSEVVPSFLELQSHDTVMRYPAVGEVFVSRSGKAAYYHAELRDLAYSTNYRYRVCTGERYSDWYAFHTQDSLSDTVCFAFFGDVQDTVGGNQGSGIRRYFDHWIADWAFVVYGGDLCERPTDASWRQTFLSIDSIAQSMPVLACTGNHDYIKGLHRRLERRFPLVFSYFLDSQVEGNMVYSLYYKNIHLILLDSNRGRADLKRQRRWLENQLATNHARWIIVVVHHPMYSVRNHNHARQQAAFNDLFQKYKVDLVLQGHEHAYAAMHKGHTTYTISHFSPKKYRVRNTDGFRVVDTLAHGYVQMLTVTDSVLEMFVTDDSDDQNTIDSYNQYPIR